VYIYIGYSVWIFSKTNYITKCDRKSSCITIHSNIRCFSIHPKNEPTNFKWQSSRTSTFRKLYIDSKVLNYQSPQTSEAYKSMFFLRSGQKGAYKYDWDASPKGPTFFDRWSGGSTWCHLLDGIQFFLVIPGRGQEPWIWWKSSDVIGVYLVNGMLAK
jgi:hypothetical protein